MSSKSDDGDDFTPTVTPDSNAIDSSDSIAKKEENNGRSNQDTFTVYNIRVGSDVLCMAMRNFNSTDLF